MLETFEVFRTHLVHLIILSERLGFSDAITNEYKGLLYNIEMDYRELKKKVEATEHTA